jgi:hypothetical protein
MRLVWVVPAALVCTALSGCLWGRREAADVCSRGAAMAGVVGEDVVYLDYAVIERTLGESYLTRELWKETDEEIVRVEGDPAASLERKTQLTNNGFRVGQISGLMPTKLHDALDSQRGCEKRQIQMHAGRETVVTCGSPWSQCRCRLNRGERIVTADFQKAQCQLVIEPTLAEEGHIRLHFTPQIHYGENHADFRSVRDADGLLHWERQEHTSEEVYSWLSWTLTVAPDEFVVIGTVFDRGDSLGEHFFLTCEEDQPIVQRLLVVRAAHVPTPTSPNEQNLGRCPPLALRAGMKTARGRGE